MTSSYAVEPAFPYCSQDRLIQLQNSARDSHESQISALEQRSKKALDQCAKLADFVEKTDTRSKNINSVKGTGHLAVFVGRFELS